MRPAPSVGLALLLLGCPPPEDTGTPFVADGPVLEHSPSEDTLVEGESLEIAVTASDDDGVAGVRLYHRDLGDDAWDWTDLEQGDAGWSTTLELDDPGLEYYFKGTDSGEYSAVSYLPADAGNAPFQIDVLVAAQALPFSESFELGDGQDELRDLGWVSYEAEFPGYPWEITDSAADGTTSVRHAVGNGDASDQMDDWLIAPALDFSTMERIQLSWYELGTQTELAQHELHLSTGSRNPAHGEFELVETLMAPGEDWARSAVVDLSDYGGERVVWLAWRYQGADADSWSIDMVSVDALAPDLSAAVASDPETVHPGDEVKLELTVDNATEVSATDVIIDLYVDMGEGGVHEDSVELGDVPGGGASVGQLFFDLAETLPDNSRLPYEITLTSGEHSWTQDFELQLGYPSSAVVDFTLDETAVIEISVGVGDPDDPFLEHAVLTATEPAGEGTVELDITDDYDLLPPAPGDDRWFARVTANTTGSVDAFRIGFGGDEYEATVLPTLEEGVEQVVYLPEPPDPVVQTLVTTPATVQPGDLGVTFSTLTLYNQGDASSGPLLASLTSSDPAVTILDGGPLLVSADAWIASETSTLVNAFAFDVSADKLDSQPVIFELTLEDEIEQFELELEVAVPWPVLRIVRVQVEDDDNDDGILDPGETATLEIEVANTGDQDTDGIARGTLAVLPSSTASATVLSEEESFGQIEAGDSRSEDFDIVVTAGAAGDVLALEVEVSDGTATFTPSFEFVLGEPPWLAAAAVDDEVGDVLDGYAFDWVNAWYRVHEGMFQLRCEATSTVDPSTVFIEGWGNSSGSGFVLYQLVIAGGAADLLGWPDYGSHDTITTPTVSADGNELLIEWDPAVMDLSIDGFSMGFGAGWCGPPEYYCDSFPDSWGYPYDSYNSGLWLDMEW